MKVYSVTKTIDAVPQVIWDVLTDATKYPEWDKGVERVEGTIAEGKKFKIFTKATPGKAFPIKVTEFDTPERMTWRGGMPFGLFKGERVFVLTHMVDDTTKFFMEEVFSGLLSPLILKSMPDLTEAFEQTAEGLKKRAEEITRQNTRKSMEAERDDF